MAKTFDALVAPSFGAPGFEARAKTWDEPACPDNLRGRHIAISGANSGIGFAAATLLARHGATVHMLCRNEERGAQAASAVAEIGAEPVLHIVDIADLASVASFCRSFLKASYPLDALVHNAGALVHDRQRTDQGLELTFACHVAGPFLATRMLFPVLSHRAETGGRSRVVFVSSGGMYTQKLDLQLLQEGPQPYDGLVSYAQCKRAQVLLAERFAELHNRSPIAFSSMHPGWVETPGVSASLPTFDRVTKPLLRTPEQGADTVVWLAASPQSEGASGEFYLDREPRRKHIVLRDTRSPTGDVDALYALLDELTMPYRGA